MSCQVMIKALVARVLQIYQVTFPVGYKLEVAEKFTKLPYDDINCTLVPQN